MKTNLFMALAFAFLMLFAACTEEKIIYVEKDNDVELLPGEGILTISLSDITTRAARPIDHFDPSTDLSSGGNNVNRIGFRIYNNSGNLVSGVKVTSWNGNEITDETDLNSYILDVTAGLKHGEKYKLKLSGLSVGPFTIVAYGYNGDTCPYTIEAVDGEMYLKALTKDEDEFFEELFAGSLEVRTNKYGNFSQEYTLTLYRQVAGMLAYFENIPTHVGTDKVYKITVSTIQKISGFYFPHTLLSDGSYPFESHNGIASGWMVYDLLTFTFEKNSSVTNWNNAEPGDTYKFGGDEGKKYLLPDEMDNDVKEELKKSLNCIDNTLFGSCFLLPASGNNTTHEFGRDTKTALHIVFKGKDDKVLKFINLIDENNKENSSLGNFSIERNHFYTLGTKNDKEDEPLDINTNAGYDYLYLSIDDGWESSHNLGKNP